MSEQNRWRERENWAELGARLRRNYDRLSPGERAELARCHTLDELRTEGTAWALFRQTFDVALTTNEMARFLPSLLLYPYAAHGTSTPTEPFLFGAWMRRSFDETQGARFLRRIMAATSFEATVTQIGYVLRATRRPTVDWAELGADLIFLGFIGRPRAIVGQQWASAFYCGRVEPEEGDDAEIDPSL